MLSFTRHLYISLLFITLNACSSGNDNTPTSTRGENFVSYESGQVRPLALTPDGNLLLATNTPNNTIEIFTVSSAGLAPLSTVPVGMEPVAIAIPNNNEAWVVNHLSDSISILDLTSNPVRVARTLHVGDEPRDIVFAGTGNKFAFITTAHRGQNGADDAPVDAELKTPSAGRADVWVFDTNSSDTTLGGAPLTIINLFADTPRALAVSADGNTVYAAAFLSGNQTTTIGQEPLAKASPTENNQGILQPETGLIVKFDGTNWVDEAGTNFSAKVPFTLPDYDVFSIDASLATPAEINTPFSGVGTVLFNMVTHPTSGAIYVSNTEALNLTRFEGPGTLSGSSVRGNFAKSRITVIKNGVVTPVNLNPDSLFDFTTNGTQAERDIALTIPLEMAISANGNTLYTTAFGSQKIAIYNITELDAGNTANATRINLPAGGPSGLILNETLNQLYVLTRFDNGISVINTSNNSEIAHLNMYNPEPDDLIAGRPFLYDSTTTSSHGTSSCGLCHVFGDLDGLAWDLGNPDDDVVANNNSFVLPDLRPPTPLFHPMKGPMTTQSLRGLKGNGPMHWRGDRTGANRTATESLEMAAFKDFNVAFPGLLGNDAELPAPAMQSFAEFALQLTYPPNPIRALDNSLTTSQNTGRSIYLNDVTTGGFFQCNTCHVVDPANGHFGTAGLSSVEGDEISQEFKVPHLRNMYTKVGKFGNSGGFSTDPTSYGDQIKGFGFMHDGGMDTLDKFLSGGVFLFDQDPTTNAEKRSNVVDFVLAMGSEMAPIVGQQVTLTSSSGTDVHNRIDLLIARSQITTPRAECDLIAKGVINNQNRGYLLQASGSFQSDKQSEVLSDTELRALVNSNAQTLTFTCVPPGSGIWMGIDRDEDGAYDRDELDNSTDPLGI